MATALQQAFGEDSIRANAVALDAQHALEICADLLVSSGRVTPEYGQQMIQVLEELGPYFVIAPGIALAHAKPGESVLSTGLSLLTLVEPVVFGHESNDPVELIIGLCAVDHDSHLELMAELAALLSNVDTVNSVLNASDSEQIRSLF